MMLTADEVIWAFRYCLGRSPESADVVRAHSYFPNWLALRNALLETREFVSSFRNPLLQNRWVVCPVIGGERLMWVDLGDRFVSQGCLFDDYEPAESQFVRSHLKRGDNFLDIGANIGWFTLLASTIVGDTGKIDSFEPREITNRYLNQSVRINNLGKLVTVHALGVSDQESGSFLSWTDGTDNPGGSFVSGVPLGGNVISQEIQLTTLDKLDLKKVDFIKIDIEGSEYRAMIGGSKTIDRHRPIILSEVNPTALTNVSSRRVDEYFQLFLSRGYRIFVVDSILSGEEITTYPRDWPKDLINVGMIPSERL